MTCRVMAKGYGIFSERREADERGRAAYSIRLCLDERLAAWGLTARLERSLGSGVATPCRTAAGTILVQFPYRIDGSGRCRGRRGACVRLLPLGS
jgi:hypothetical protein